MKLLREDLENKDLVDFIKNALKDLESGYEGTYYSALGTSKNGTQLYYVLSTVDANQWIANEEDRKWVEDTLRTDPTKKYVICGKIAVNSDDLQADYDYDWTMPYAESSGETIDTDHEIAKSETPEEIAKDVLGDFNILKGLNISEKGAILAENLKESIRVLKEQVSDEAYKVAERINDYFSEDDFISRDDFDEQFAIAIREVFNLPNDEEHDVWMLDVLPNGNDPQDFEADVRGILAYDGWNTIFEGDDEGGLEQLNAEKPRVNELIYDALREYEENHHDSEGRTWQKVINKLIDYYDMHMTDEHDVEKYGYLDESCKSKKKGKKLLKETWRGEDVINDLVDRAKLWLEDGHDKDEAVKGAIEEGLIYTRDIIDLGEHYGVINDSELIDKYYEYLYEDIYNKLAEEDLKECYTSKKKKKPSKNTIKESYENELERLEKILYGDWSVSDVGDAYEIETSSPAGEDIVEYLYKEDIVESARKIAENFDEDEHVEMLLNAKAGGFQGVPSARVLVQDAEEIKELYEETYEKIKKEFENK